MTSPVMLAATSRSTASIAMFVFPAPASVYDLRFPILFRLDIRVDGISSSSLVLVELHLNGWVLMGCLLQHPQSTEQST